MARQQVRASDSFEKVDPVWNRIRREAEEAVRTTAAAAPAVAAGLAAADLSADASSAALS